MDALWLTYIPEDDWHGQLHASVQASMFSGRSSAWFNRETLVAFSSGLAKFPLPVDEPAAISGGLYAVAGSALKEVHVGISIGPFNVRGTLLVRVELATEDYASPGGDCRQRATLQFLAEYAALDSFRRSLNWMLDSGDGEAILQGMNP